MASAKESRIQTNDFTTPDAFRNIMVQEETLESGEKIKVAMLQKNSILYRAGSMNARATDESEPGWNMPLFMSDLETIGPYKNSGRALMRGVTKKNLRLFVLEMDSIVKILGDLAPTFESDPEIEEMYGDFIFGYLVRSDESLERPDAIFPAQRVSPEFAEMFYPELPTFAYNNRIFAKLICMAGYDGWISFPGSGLKQRNINMAEYKRTGQIKFKHNPYEPEVVICKPVENLVYGPVRAPASATASAKGAKKSKAKHATKRRTKGKTKRGTRRR